jgi:hypothetical protein
MVKLPCSNSCIELAQLLLQNPEIDVNKADKLGETPLHLGGDEFLEINLTEFRELLEIEDLPIGYASVLRVKPAKMKELYGSNDLIFN